MKIGAKLSIDNNWEEVKEIAHMYDFIEVYGNPKLEFEKKYLEINNFFALHASHHVFGVNLSKNHGSNIEISERNIVFASQLDIKFVVIHSGAFPSDRSADKEQLFQNTILNLKRLNNFANKNGVRLLVENLPLVLDNKENLFGSNVDEIKEIISGVGCGFCLDFSHAAHSAFSHRLDFKKFVLELAKLDPDFFHLYDTQINQDIDLHVPFGQGSMDIPFCLSVIKNKPVTLEIVPTDLQGFTYSLRYIKQLMQGR